MLSEAERAQNRRENLALAQADEAAWVGPKPEWWLSFVDTAMSIPREERRPGGPSFLGVVIVSAVNAITATGAAWACGANPGGQVATYGPNPPGTFPEKWMNRLLSREDVAALEAEMS